MSKLDEFDRYRRIMGWRIGDKITIYHPFIITVQMDQLHIGLQISPTNPGPWAVGQTLSDAIGSWWVNNGAEYEITKKQL